jgi:beta-N-acetylhexosaminidase
MKIPLSMFSALLCDLCGKKKTLLSIFVWAISISPLCATELSEMTLEEKVGQLLMVHFHGEETNNAAKMLVQDLHVGSIIYYNWANGLHSPHQVRRLSRGLQKLAEENRMPIPLLIAVDQEGGAVSRLSRGFTVFPGNKALGMTGDPALAELSAFAIGRELLSVGINMNLAPVVDVNSNPQNPVIGIRAFGESPEIVVAFAKKALEGFQNAGIITSLKHFPGHGAVESDSHEMLPILNKTHEELVKTDLLPFTALAPFAHSIMTAHILVPALDPHNCITLSEKGLKILREQLSFEGVIISDSLVMESILKNSATGEIAEIALQAINAGCDLLILGGKQLTGADQQLELSTEDVRKIYQKLVEAVKTGTLPEKRLNQAVQRILHLKERIGFNQQQLSSVDLLQHQQLAYKIASLAIKIRENNLDCQKQHLFPFAQKYVAFYGPEYAKEELQLSGLAALGGYTIPTYYPSEDELQQAFEADCLLICSYNAWKNPLQSAHIQALIREKPAILVSMGEELDASLFSNASLIVETFSPTLCSLQAACKLLKELE